MIQTRNLLLTNSYKYKLLKRNYFHSQDYQLRTIKITIVTLMLYFGISSRYIAPVMMWVKYRVQSNNVQFIVLIASTSVIFTHWPLQTHPKGPNTQTNQLHI